MNIKIKMNMETDMDIQKDTDTGTGHGHRDQTLVSHYRGNFKMGIQSQPHHCFLV
jgi:hypothetical protein